MVTENEEERYFANLTANTSFQKTFANEKEKEPLITMLNVFLAKKLAHPIVDVHIKNPYVAGQTNENRDSVFDILCKDSEGRQFMVEMQVGRQAYFLKRIIFYVCMAIANDAPKGDWDFNFTPIYSISFLNFELDFGNDDVIQYVSLSNELHPEIRYNYISMVLVRLTRFEKSIDECETMEDKLIFSLCHAHELKGKPPQFGEDVFEKIFSIARISNFTSDELGKYEVDMLHQRDMYAIRMTAINDGKAEGIAIGEAKGIAIGEAKGRNEVLDLMAKGYSLEQIKEMLKS